MSSLKKNMENLKHPNSRKTMSLSKRMKKQERREHSKLGTHIKQNLLGEKILWFKERIPEECKVLTKEQTLQLIETYLARFEGELEQIGLKNSIGQRIYRRHQHASREDIIAITKQREHDEFETCGIEMPHLMDPQQMEVLRNWNGEFRYLPVFKLKKIARKSLIKC